MDMLLLMGADSGLGTGPGPAVPWRKVLWERQPFPDNYVDHRFLEELRRNEGLRQYRYWAVVREAGLVAQQISCVALFLTLWLYMEQGLLSPSTLLWSGLLCALLGYGFYQALGPQGDSDSQQRTRWSDLQSASIFLSFTFGFSPVLRTLTESVSTDTVYAMTALMLLAHLVSFPYAQPSPPGSLSLNAALFASVCLASRLPGDHRASRGLNSSSPSSLHTFTMLCWALLVFALWPCLRQRLRECAPQGFGCVCLLMGLSGVGGLGSIWPGGAVLLAAVLGAVTLLCPLLLIRLQSDKDNIHGPWDEAEIREDLARFLR
uniref:Phosphatidylinositol glycan anchor biosynthesis, class C n=1 Tax=Esox lucius TaxID=8010 RepID=A0A3P8XN19_ESOLU